MSKRKHTKRPVQLLLLILLIVLMLVSFCMSFIPVGNAQEPEPEITVNSDGRLCAEGEVLVKFHDDMSEEAAQSTLNEFDSAQLDVSNDIIVTEVPDGETVESFVDSLEALPNVEYAQPNYIYTLERTVNDGYIGSQWHLDKIGAFNAWDTTMGSSDIRVAVIDTGVDLNHPDLTGQIVAQADVVANDGSAQDDDGHGTHVAGIIAAKADNGIGVAGVAPGVKLIAVDVFTYYMDNGTLKFGASSIDVVKGIEYAVSNDADVINLSLGHYGSEDTLLKNAIDSAVSLGVVCVAAAGNNSSNQPHYPGDFESCISVTATDWNDSFASYSNYGPEKDISAPGGDSNSMPDSLILSTVYDARNHTSGYEYQSGTSMASPVVAGVVALMLSANPSLGVNDVKNILYNTAVDLCAPGRDDFYGYGRINANAAVAMAAGIPYIPIHPTGVALDKTSLGLFVGDTYHLTASVSPFTASNKAITYSSNNTDVATVSYIGIVTAKREGLAEITATTADGGFQSTCQLTVKSGLIASDIYTIDRTNKVLKGLLVNTSAAQLKANLKNAPEEIKIYDASGTLYTGSKLCTGMTIKLEFGTGVRDSLAIALLGDTSGDGNISISDYTYIRLHILGLSALSGVKAAAADVDKSGSIDIADYTYTRLHILNLKLLY